MRASGWVFSVTDGIDALFEGRRDLLSAPEVAELLGMTKQGTYHWLRDGVIPGYKLGSTWYILRDELKEALKQGSNRPREGTVAQERDETEA